MAKKSNYAIGVDLGGTFIKIGIVSDKGKIVNKISIDTFAEEGPKKVISQIKKGIKELLSNNKYKISGIGIGAPGVINAKSGIVENPPNLPGWGKVKLGSVIKKEFGLNVFVENDANAAAVGEFMFGAGKKLKSFVMVTLGTGVGGGIIYNGKLFRGNFGAAGEIGHTTIDHKGPKCNCGSYGCIETYIGNNNLIKRTNELLKKNNQSLINKLIENNPANLTPKIIHEAAELGDDFAKEIINDTGYLLGTSIASISNLLDIGKFIVGGGVAGFGERLFAVTSATAKQRVLKSLSSRIEILSAKLKNEAGIKGASALVFFRT